jgi:hypothetical protein
LNRTNFTDTLLPITSLINLESLSITNCDNITGSIPDEFYGLKNLIYLNFDQTNELRGGLSYKIGNLMNLTFLQLGQNLGGKFPLEICNLSKLEYLLLDNTGMTGVLPSEIVNLRNLKQLDLLNNRYLTCNLTTGVCNLLKLNLLHMSGGSIGGVIPPEIAQLKELKHLILGHNFTGKIPVEIGQLSELETLWIAANKLDGVIPREITNLKKLNLFWIFRNKFRFIDFAPEFQAYKTKLGSAFDYSNQAKINAPEAITKPSGQPVGLKMYADGDTRYLVDDTYQWFKNGNAMIGANSSEYTIPSLLSTDAGTYTCRSYHLTNPDMSPLVLEREPITLVVTASNGCVTGTIETPIPATTIDGITVSFNTTSTGLTYEWRFYYLNGTTSGEVYTTPIASRKFQDAGIYKVTLDVTDATGCKAHFERNVTVTHLCTLAEGTIKLDPIRKDDTVVVGYPTGFSVDAKAWVTNEEWTFYNLDGTVKETLKSPITNPITQTYTVPGLYLVTVTIKDFYGCPTTFEKKIKVVETCNIPAEERVFPYSFYVDNHTIYNYKATNILVNSVASISFQDYYYRPADVVYRWNLYDPNGNLVETSTQPIFTATPTLLGDYKVDVQVTDNIGCSTNYIITMNVVDICTFSENTRDGRILVTDDYDTTSFVKINESKELYFRIYNEDPEKSFSYQWRLYDPKLVLIGEGNQKTFPFTLTTGGFHKVVLVIKDNATGCTTEHSKIIGCLIGNSCTELNPKSVVVKDLYFNLLKNLISRSLLGETDAQINASMASPELIALKPYITNGTGDKIYNYISTRYGDGVSSRDGGNGITQIDFSFAPNREYDVHLSIPRGIYFDENWTTEELSSNIEESIYFNLNQYSTSNDYLVSCYYQQAGKNANPDRVILQPGDCDLESEVRYVDFCPVDCIPIAGTLKSTPQVLNANVNATFSLETTATNLIYDWTFYNLDNTTEIAKASTAIATQSFGAAGRYRVVLNVKDEKGCITPFETFTTVLPACTPITGVIKIGSGSTPTTTPNPTTTPTQSYWYKAVHPLIHSGTDYVIYIDGNGVKQTITLTRTESGYDAPCTEIIASRIFNHAGAIPCVLE